MLSLIGWTTVGLVAFQKNDGRRHNSEMEPQETTIDSPFHTRRQSKTFRPAKTTLGVRVHVPTLGSMPSPGGDCSLDIAFHRTSAITRLSRSLTYLRPFQLFEKLFYSGFGGGSMVGS